MDPQYLDNLDEFIKDENQIVTYRWLSLTLNVSSNSAKQMLYHYLEKSKDSDKECKLTATYLLSGLQFDEELKQEVYKVCVVQDDKLEKLKSTFKAIYSLHVYSLQKVKLKDLHTLYGVDHDKIKEDIFQSAQYSSISPSSPFRSNVESKREIRAASPKKFSPQKNIATCKADANAIVENKENKFKENTTFQKNTKENAAFQKNAPKKAKGSLQSMFANQAKRQETKKPLEVKQEPNLNSSSKSISDAVKKKGSLDAFVSKGAKTKSPPEEIRKSPRKKQEEEIVIKEEMDVVDSSLSKEAEVEKKAQLTPKKKGNNKTTKSKKKSPVRECKRKSTSTDLKSTKRQRIMTLQDSSSESSSEEEEEVLIDDSPMPSPPPKTLESDDDDDESPFPPTPKPDESAEKTQLNKRKKRKMVDKTFIDEKGFFVTNKKCEYVTDSDEENPFPSAKSISLSKSTNFTSPVKKESPKKNASSVKSSPQKKNGRSPKKSSPQKKKNKKSPAKVKQSSITSFFKAKN